MHRPPPARLVSPRPLDSGMPLTLSQGKAVNHPSTLYVRPSAESRTRAT